MLNLFFIFKNVLTESQSLNQNNHNLHIDNKSYNEKKTISSNIQIISNKIEKLHKSTLKCPDCKIIPQLLNIDDNLMKYSEQQKPEKNKTKKKILKDMNKVLGKLQRNKPNTNLQRLEDLKKVKKIIRDENIEYLSVFEIFFFGLNSQANNVQFYSCPAHKNIKIFKIELIKVQNKAKEFEKMFNELNSKIEQDINARNNFQR